MSIVTMEAKALRRQVIHRLLEKGVIERHPQKSNVIRYVNTQIDTLDILNASKSGSLPINWGKFNLERLCDLYAGNIAIIAGEPNCGKTAFLLNLAKDNRNTFKVTYFSSEMFADELRLRLDLFDDIDIQEWLKVEWLQRSNNFADVVRPSGLNIIDYMELNVEIWMIAEYLSQIQRKLKTGIAIIGIQKKIGQDIGRGLEFSLEKPRLYLSMFPDRLKIIKAKLWRNREINPNGLECNFKIVNGNKFVNVSQWHDSNGVPVDIWQDNVKAAVGDF